MIYFQYFCCDFYKIAWFTSDFGVLGPFYLFFHFLIIWRGIYATTMSDPSI